MIFMQLNIIATIQPNAKYLKEIIIHPMLNGIRYNTAIPINKPKKKVIHELKKKIYPKNLWIDLKCRELRIKDEVTVPDELITLNHKIDVKTPTAMYFNEGEKYLIIEEVIDGDKLVIKAPPNVPKDFKIHFGKMASVNIPDVTKIHGFLTSNDIEYIHAAMENDIHDYMISFVEKPSDIEKVLEIDPDAQIIAKIESQKGIRFVEEDYDRYKDKVRLMAARGDLYIELDRPHKILNMMKLLIEKDPNAIAASRILLSVLESDEIPSCADLCDIGFILELGYKHVLLGDHVCEDETALKNAIGILEAIQEDFLDF